MTESGAIAFTDIVGFTQFTASEGDERAIKLLDTKRRIVDRLLPADGRVVKELGDGLMLWIEAPESAMKFCRDAQAAFRQASDEGPLPLWVRIGVHWGDPTERAGDLIGHDVNTAARIVGQAGPGETLASDALVKQCDPSAAGVDAEPIGPVLMKGLPAAIWLYRLT
jgi:class 3 adenylate cyclase